MRRPQPETANSRALRDFMIVKFKLAGHTRKSIAEVSLCSPSVVTRVLRQNGRFFRDQGQWRWYSFKSILARLTIDDEVAIEVGAEPFGTQGKGWQSPLVCKMPIRQG